MPRRALRNVDPALDISAHFFPMGDSSPSWTPERWFKGNAPIELEVGSGKGLFLANAAAGSQDRNFLGIEIASKYARFAAARLARLGLTNAVLLCGDGKRFIRDCVPSASLAAIHVYFPDPWWKARHKKRRLLNASFVQDVERILTPGGALHFWTDVQEYFTTGLAVIAASTSLAGPFEPPARPAEHDLDYRTHFERRTRLHGQPVYRAEFRKPLR